MYVLAAAREKCANNVLSQKTLPASNRNGFTLKPVSVDHMPSLNFFTERIGMISVEWFNMGYSHKIPVLHKSVRPSCGDEDKRCRSGRPSLDAPAGPRSFSRHPCPSFQRAEGIKRKTCCVRTGWFVAIESINNDIMERVNEK